MNPIWKREFFARWRDWRSHLLLLALALLLSAAAYWSYHNALQHSPINYRVYPPRPIAESLATRASRAGHALFSTLAIGNVAVWFIMAPLLTATGVARERERGLLESLQLSRMSSRSQVLARAGSAMLYLLALQLVTLPVYFVAFSFGGVSPGEIARAWLLVGFTAWCGVGLGLMLSAGAGRPSGALFGAVALLCGWSLVAYWGFLYSFSPWGLLDLGPSTRPLAQVFYWSHPILVAFNLCEPAAVRPPSFFGLGWFLGAFPALFPLCLVAWFCVGTFGLWKASRDVTRAFAPSGWAGRNLVVEKWKRRREERLEAQRQRASAKVEGALLADLPFDRLIRFKNPLLNREVKGRFRLRRASVPLWIGRAAVFVCAVGGWVLAMRSVFDPVGRSNGVSIVLWMEWVLGAALVGTFAASGFAREREAGTWEGVRLSLLSNGQIARTKWASPLIAFALLTSPLWALIFAFLPIGEWSGVPFRVLFAGALVVAASLAFVSALAGWISLRARNTTTATCWTLGALLALFFVAPVLWATFEMSNWSARQITGVAPPTRSFYNYDVQRWTWQDDVRELYARETGRVAPVSDPYDYGTFSSVPEEIEHYRGWCDAKQKQAVRVAALSGVWNPGLVLSEFEKTKGAGTSNDQRLAANDLALMALCHALLCVGAIAILLWGVTRRLELRLE